MTGLQASRIIRHWGKLGRETIPLMGAPVASWEPAQGLIDAHQPLRKESEALLRRLDARFKPLQDPFRETFGAHRWLAAEREESYSDWLAWILDSLPEPGMVLNLLLPNVAIPTNFRLTSLSIERETEVRKDEDERGRLDIFIQCPEVLGIILEVKKKAPDRLDNLPHYRKRLRQVAAPSDQEHFVLLASTFPSKLPAFIKALTWEDLCLRSRRTARGLLSRPARPVLAAMVLGFVGAVEQNLLGYTRYSIEYLQKILKILEELT